MLGPCIRPEAFATTTSERITARKRSRRKRSDDPPKRFPASFPPAYTLRVGELRGNCAGQRFCQTRCLTFCMKWKGETVVNSEITTKTTKGRHGPSPCRRIGKDSA